MSAEDNTEIPVDEDVEQTAPVGEKLKLAREAKGWTRQQVAEKLFLTEEIIVAIEEQSFHVPRSVAFYRGYIRNYANLLEVSPDELLAALDDVLGEVTPTVRDMPEDLVPGSRRRKVRWGVYFKWVIGSLLIVMVASAVYVWQRSTPSLPVAPASVPPKNDAGRGALSLSLPEENDASLDSVEQTTDDSDESSSVETLVSETEGPSAKTMVEAATEPPKMAEGTLTFDFSGYCWVEVYDATGERLAIGNKKPGYQMTVTGMAPFRVILGNASVVKIRYNDAPVDLTGTQPGRRTEITIPAK